MKNELPISVLRALVHADFDTGILTALPGRPNVRPGRRLGANDGGGYLTVCVNHVRIKSHRVVWALAHDEWPLFDIDHINGDKHDNRLCNLRLVTRAQNCWNRRVTGVELLKGRYRARLARGKLRRFLGSFSSFAAARAAYKKAHAELHGEFSPYYVKAEA